MLSGLHSEMTQDSVERVILQTNAALITPQPPSDAVTGNSEEGEYQNVREAMTRISRGQPVNFQELQFHRALFNLNPDSLDRIAAPKSSASHAVFIRSCCQLMFRWTR
ncbi:MAG: hypothetical protein ACREYE_23890 [Gammaproteobacteria bacterium]